MAVLSTIRTFTNENKRFVKTSPESLLQYALLMYGELREKVRNATTPNEAMWYSDLAALLLELGCRYDDSLPIVKSNPAKVKYSNCDCDGCMTGDSCLIRRNRNHSER